MYLTSLYIRLFKFIINKISKTKKLFYLGTEYGGWHFIHDENLENSLMISAGVGEDISFDIEMINKYKIKVILIDPTPRSIEHINKVSKSLGKSNTKEFLDGGSQPIEAYNLKDVNKNDFTLIKKALFNKSNQIVKFFEPPNADHVSHSISNWQNDFKKESKFIEVETISISDIVNFYNIDNIPLLKLDIEGAEIEVVNDMLKNKILPKQLLVEFDELYKNSLKGYLRATYIFFKLLINGYKLINANKFPNFLFVSTKVN